jgi:hypothetical protein
MDQTLAYGLGAGSGVVEYYLAKKMVPTSPNLAAGALGVATLGLKLFNVIPHEYSDVATANALTLIAIAGANAVTNPSAMGVVTLRPNY